jgi:hypothetical protein
MVFLAFSMSKGGDPDGISSQDIIDHFEWDGMVISNHRVKILGLTITSKIVSAQQDVSNDGCSI